MKRILLLGAAALGMFAGNAFADESQHAGLYVAAGVTHIDGDLTFSGGKPAETLSGYLPTLRAGGDVQFDHIVLGASAFTSYGDGFDSPAVRDGNYLVQQGHEDSVKGWEVRAGLAFGQLLVFGAYGQNQSSIETTQSCPADWNAAPFGFCHGGGVAATGIARQGTRKGAADLTANTWSVGAEWNLTRHWFVSARYSESDAESAVVSLNPTGDTAGQLAHPPTDPHQSAKYFGGEVAWRF